MEEAQFEVLEWTPRWFGSQLSTHSKRDLLQFNIVYVVSKYVCA